MSGTYLSPSFNFYKHVRSNNSNVEQRHSHTQLRISQSRLCRCQRSWYSCPLLSAMLAGLRLQHMLHTSVCFASCNRSDPSVLVARKSRSRTEILANTGTQMKKNQLLKNNGTYSATFTVVILYKARNVHYHYFSWNSQITFNDSTSTCPLTTPTKSHPHKFNHCNLFFAMLYILWVIFGDYCSKKLTPKHAQGMGS